MRCSIIWNWPVICQLKQPGLVYYVPTNLVVRSLHTKKLTNLCICITNTSRSASSASACLNLFLRCKRSSRSTKNLRRFFKNSLNQAWFAVLLDGIWYHLNHRAPAHLADVGYGNNSACHFCMEDIDKFKQVNFFEFKFLGEVIFRTTGYR